jgi:hypothetical protein
VQCDEEAGWCTYYRRSSIGGARTADYARCTGGERESAASGDRRLSERGWLPLLRPSRELRSPCINHYGFIGGRCARPEFSITCPTEISALNEPRTSDLKEENIKKNDQLMGNSMPWWTFNGENIISS